MENNDNNSPLTLEDLARMVKEGFDASKADLTALESRLLSTLASKEDLATLRKEFGTELPPKIARRFKQIEKALNLDSS